jgi:hypothetical protein
MKSGHALLRCMIPKLPQRALLNASTDVRSNDALAQKTPFCTAGPWENGKGEDKRKPRGFG